MFGELHRGEIVIFRREGKLLVKRIAALPGDKVYIDDDLSTTSVNQYIAHSRTFTVPEGQFFLLGDNSTDSNDGRFWDPPFIPECDIIAVLLVFW